MMTMSSCRCTELLAENERLKDELARVQDRLLSERIIERQTARTTRTIWAEEQPRNLTEALAWCRRRILEDKESFTVEELKLGVADVHDQDLAVLSVIARVVQLRREKRESEDRDWLREQAQRLLAPYPYNSISGLLENGDWRSLLSW